jgi:hypothetical protein
VLVYPADGLITIKILPQLRQNEFLTRNKPLNFASRKDIKKTILQEKLYSISVVLNSMTGRLMGQASWWAEKYRISGTNTDRKDHSPNIGIDGRII